MEDKTSFQKSFPPFIMETDRMREEKMNDVGGVWEISIDIIIIINDCWHQQILHD